MPPLPPFGVGRRAVLAGIALAAIGCGSPPVPPVSPGNRELALPPLNLGELAQLLPIAHLRWIVQARPRAIAQIPWLIPHIATILPEDNLNQFLARTGLDLRQLPEALIAEYEDGDQVSSLYLVRHNGNARGIERLFRARFTAEVHRVAVRPDVVRISGRIGATPAVITTLGSDVVAFQFGGHPSRGPARITELYATEKLKKSPTVFAQDPLRSLVVRVGDAPLRAFAVGPFTGELARGARGLLSGATAIGTTARPSGREGILLVIAVAGDFASSEEAASRELVGAWTDLADSSFGHLLGLDAAIEGPLAMHSPEAVSIAIELSPARLATGLHAATSARIDEIMK